MEFVNFNDHEVRVTVKVPKLEGDYFYRFNVILPDYTIIRDPNNNSITGTTFGPDTTNWGGAWRHGGSVTAGSVPFLQNGYYNWRLTTLYPFAGETAAELLARAQAAWGNKPIDCTATPGS